MQTDSLRRSVGAVSTLANRDLAALWRQVTSAAQARDALMDVLPALVDKYGAAAATLAATWYDEGRREADVRGRFEATPVDLGTGSSEALARWGVTPLFKAEPDFVTAQSLVAGGLQRRIADFSRATVTSNAVADPQSRGWQRTGSGECAFCALLIGRGAVYSESTADFASHDSCKCSAIPAWSGSPVPVKPYTPSARNISDADRALVREYLRTH